MKIWLSSVYFVYISDFDEQDDAELVRLSEIFEKEYYGYITDDELIRASDLLFNIYETTATHETKGDLQTLPEKMETTSTAQSNQMNKSYDDDSDEYYWLN